MKVQKSACLAAAALLFGGSLATMEAANGQAMPLKLVKTIPLPGFTGDFDHFAVDSDRGRLLLAGEDHKTVEVFDLKTMAHLKSLDGFAAPHSFLIRPGVNTILVVDGFAGMSKVLDANTYEKKGLITLTPGADSLAYDQKANRVYIVTGGKDVDMATSEIDAVDPDSGKKLGAITIDSNHTEALAVQQNGNRIFVNLTDHNSVEVIDKNTMKKIAEWPVKLANQNSPMAFDEGAHRLFLACRQPAMMVVMNSDTGQETASLPGPLRADDMPYDPASHRLYMLGDSYIAVYDVSNPDHPKLIHKVPSAIGAKTGMVIPSMNELVVAASPGESKAMAKVMVYDIQP